jgi:hypothetical protein
LKTKTIYNKTKIEKIEQTTGLIARTYRPNNLSSLQNLDSWKHSEEEELRSAGKKIAIKQIKNNKHQTK